MTDLDVYETIAEAIVARKAPVFAVPGDEVTGALSRAFSFESPRQSFQQWLIMRVATLSSGTIELEPISAAEVPGPLEDRAVDSAQVVYLRMNVAGEPFSPPLAVGPMTPPVQYFYFHPG